MKTFRSLILLSAAVLLLASCKSAENDKGPDAQTQTIPGQTEDVPIQADVPDHKPADYDENMSSPIFSQESGFYAGSFELTIAAPEDCTVYYTLDGSIPTDRSMKLSGVLPVYDRSADPNTYSMMEGTTLGKFYAPSLLIDKATIIRAVAYNAAGGSSEVITKSYFVGYQDRADYYGDVAVISLVTDPEHLFDYDTGIYVTGAAHDSWRNGKNYDPKIRYWHQPANYKNSGKEWERPAHIDFFDVSGTLAFSDEIGIRMRGGASRAFLQKSFNLYARSEYGSKNIKYEIFPGLTSDDSGEVIKKYDSFMLRNGGNDTELTKIREVLIQELASGLGICAQASRPAVVFLNGEFWGLYNVQEKYSEDYIESHYGVDKNNVIIIEKDQLNEGEAADIEYYHDLLSYAAGNNLSDSVKYEEFGTMLDIADFIDYVSVEVFVGNKDWGSNNVMLWRSRSIGTDHPYEDGRWRFMLYDTEYSTGLSYENSLAYDARYNPSVVTDNTFWTIMNPNTTIGKIFTALSANESFRKQFTARFMEIADTVFHRNKVMPLLDQYADTYRPMMIDTLIRYSALSEDEAGLQFDYEVDKIRNYFNLRYDFITNALYHLFPPQ